MITLLVIYKLTHVPPNACFSIRPTETPNSAALLAEAMPPDPPPTTKYWKCLTTLTGAMIRNDQSDLTRFFSLTGSKY